MTRTIAQWMTMLLMSLLAATVSAQTVRFVTQDGTGDGSSWQKASGDLQAMIEASISGDDIWVASGTYEPDSLIRANQYRSRAFFLKNGVSLYGGFAGNETTKEERKLKPGGKAYEWAKPSILSADDDTPDVWIRQIEDGSSYRYGWRITGNEDNGNHILYCANKLTTKTVIEGFTLRGANADIWQAQAGGAALYGRGHIEVRACKFVENVATNKVEGKAFFGGAMCLLDTDDKALVEDCLFERNLAKASSEMSRGGGVYIDGGSIRNSTFRGCVSLDEGGAIYNASRNGRVEYCQIEDCYAGSGGAIYNVGSLLQNTIYDSRGLKGGGIYNKGSVTHCLVANCYADALDFGSDMGGSGGGIFVEEGSVLGSVVYNCKAFEGGGIYLLDGKVINSTIQQCEVRKPNTQEPNIRIAQGDELLISNSIYKQDTQKQHFVAPTNFAGNPSSATDSIAIRAASWALAAGSSFIDTGKLTEGITEDTDIAGNPRILGTAIDQGAYETIPGKPANIIITFASTDKEVKIGTGGGQGTTFSIDWGDGNPIEYEGAKNITQKPITKQVRIYGENLLVLQIIDQGIVALEIKGAPLLSRIQVGKNALKALDVSQNIALTGLYCEENEIASLDLKANTLLRVLDCHSNKIRGAIDCSNMTKLTKLDCSANAIEALLLPSTPTLTSLDCGTNKIRTLDLSGLSALTELSCNNNALSQIDLRANVKLENLYCPTNKLSELNVAANIALKKISANENELTTIELKTNKDLTGLYLQHNKISSLDLSANTALGWVNLEYNRLKTLELSNLSALKLLNAVHNEFAEIDLSHNPQINTLHIGNNRLKDLDVSKLPSLIWLTCDSNKIASLDLTTNIYVSWLECEANELSTLDLSKQKNLQKLFAGHNKLTSLDISTNKGLQGLLIESNPMSAPAIDAIIAALPNVGAVEIHDNNRTWARQLNIGLMPGTKDAHKEDAEAKGWYVKAEVDNHIKPVINTPLLWLYDATRTTLYATSPIYTVQIYSIDGRLALTAQEGHELSVGSLSTGIYIATGIDSFGRRVTCKFVR